MLDRFPSDGDTGTVSCDRKPLISMRLICVCKWINTSVKSIMGGCCYVRASQVVGREVMNEMWIKIGGWWWRGGGSFDSAMGFGFT